MEHGDHVEMLRPGIHSTSGVWADFGSGRGAFTLALVDILDANAVIYSTDRVSRSLREQQQALDRSHPHHTVYYEVLNFTEPLSLPLLDGIVIANALHYIEHDKQEKVVGLFKGYLKWGGRLLMVGYDTDKGNRWVPHPNTFQSWQTLAQRAGFEHTELLATRPSHFLGRFYSGASW